MAVQGQVHLLRELCPWPLVPRPMLLLQVEQSQLAAVAELVRGVMEGVAGFGGQLRVPLRVRLAAGPSWGTLSELRLAP